MSPKRPLTDTTRDVYVRKTPPKGVPVEVDEEVTGKHEGDELAQLRAKRPTHDRIARLEVKSDAQATATARMEGKLDTVIALATAKATAEVAETGRTARTKITTNGKVLMYIAGAVIAAIVTIVTLLVKGLP
jgi:hypothetical protein